MRKNIGQICLLILLLYTFTAVAQSSVPAVNLKSINGRVIPLNTVTETDSIVVISFWATWCVPCINELDAIHEKMAENENNNLFRLVAISTDEARTVHRVKPMAKSKDWGFDIFLDESNEVKRAFGVSNIPFILIVRKGKIVYQHSGYIPGDEDILFDKAKKLSTEN